MVISYPGYDELSINGVSVNAFFYGDINDAWRLGISMTLGGYGERI